MPRITVTTLPPDKRDILAIEPEYVQTPYGIVPRKTWVAYLLATH